MKDQSVVRHVIRLNMQNEQHQRIEKVLANLNNKIYKSTNQFLVDAIDSYIKSFEDGEKLIQKSEINTVKYLTEEDLSDIKNQLENDIKEEIIRLMGIFIIGNRSINPSDIASNTFQKKETTEENI